jgi:hypothetical protein
MNWLTQPVPLWRPLTALAVAEWATIFVMSSQLIHPSEFNPKPSSTAVSYRGTKNANVPLQCGLLIGDDPPVS